MAEVDGTKMDCVIAKSERYWCDLFHYMLHVMYMFLIIPMVEICHLKYIISIIGIMFTWTYNIPFVVVVVVVEEGTGVAVDGSGVGCVIAKRKILRFFYVSLNILIL